MRLTLIENQFIRKLNQFYVDARQGDLITEQIVIQNVNQQPLIKVTAHILTGWLMTFQIVVPDTFNYCDLYE